MNGDFERGSQCIEAGDDVNETDADGYCPMLTACVFRNATAGSGVCELIDLLALHGADVDAELVEDQRTPLLVASGNNHLDIVAVLLRHDANVDHQDSEGTTASMNAAFCGNIAMLELLLEAGADQSLRRTDGHSIFSIAALGGCVEVLDFLATRSCPVHDAGQTDGRGPCMLASWLGNEEAASWLADHGADLHAVDNAGDTALHLACWRDHLDVAKMLARRGVDPERVNKAGETALSHYGKDHDAHAVEAQQHQQHQQQQQEEGAEGEEADAPLSPEAKLQRVHAVQAAYEDFTRGLRWQRRWPVMSFLAGSSVQGVALRPSSGRLLALLASRLSLDPAARIDGVDRSSAAANRAYLLLAVLGEDGLQRRVVAFL